MILVCDFCDFCDFGDFVIVVCDFNVILEEFINDLPLASYRIQ